LKREEPGKVIPDLFDHWMAWLMLVQETTWKNFSGITLERNGQLVPCFPRARHVLGKADWDDSEMQVVSN
jgi:hypothetical protein